MTFPSLPSKVLVVRDCTAITECLGEIREISLALMREKVKAGDYVLLRGGGFAVEKVDGTAAAATLDAVMGMLSVQQCAERLAQKRADAGDDGEPGGEA